VIYEEPISAKTPENPPYCHVPLKGITIGKNPCNDEIFAFDFLPDLFLTFFYRFEVCIVQKYVLRNHKVFFGKC
jgi:hypothetical protein